MVGPDGLLAQVASISRSALRWESRRYADIEDERLELRAFLAGELPEVYEREPDDWTRTVARQAAAGRLVRRVRVLDTPLTDYNRYMLYCAQSSAAFGEDVRYLVRQQANQLDLPDHDFWVFDSARMVELRFTDDGRPLGHDVIVDPKIVARHEEWIIRGYAVAIPAADFLAQDPTRAWPPIRLRPVVKGA
jgi:hypothetical protein